VAQGIGYYNRFITRFPNVKSLANAEAEDVLKVWQGLGYYSRAKNFHTGAKYVLQQFNGKVPPNYEELIKIKGVGEYTAAAIGSIAFNLPEPVVDGNVNRVIARLFGIHDPINSSSGVKKIKGIAKSILDCENPGAHNQAIMEFGAIQCTIKNPDCSSCPLQNECYALLHHEVNILPNKIKQQKIRQRYFNYLVINIQDCIYLTKRSKKDIWQGLYEFPLIETEKEVSELLLVQTDPWKSIFKDTSWEIIHTSQKIKHKLSHQTINATFYLIKVNQELNHFEEKTIQVKKMAMHQFPVSKLIDNYISTSKM
jgi:A/G-specific adenine glycosylase